MPASRVQSDSVCLTQYCRERGVGYPSVGQARESTVVQPIAADRERIPTGAHKRIQPADVGGIKPEVLGRRGAGI
jgi:hypothetical protein